METNRLRQFCVVYESKNLRKAAEILGMSHSALSKSLKVLQSQLSKKLLTQNGRNIEVTEDGHGFYQKARGFLLAEEELFADETKKSDVLKIGTFEVFSTHVLGHLWGKYFSSYALELHELLPGDLESAVAAGQVDVGLTYEPIPTAGLEFLLLGKTQMKIFIKKGAFPHVAVSDLPFVAPIAPIRGTPSGSKGLDGWPDHKFARAVKFRVAMMESGLALVRSGEAAIFLPPFVANHHNKIVSDEHQLVEKHLPKGMKPVERKIYLILKRSTEEDGKIKKLASLVRKECL